MSNPTMKKADVIAVAIVIPICLYVFYESTEWPVVALLGRPFVIPRGVAGFLLIAVLILLYRALKGRAFLWSARIPSIHCCCLLGTYWRVCWPNLHG